MSDQKTTKWLDLSEYGVSLHVIKIPSDPSPRNLLVLAKTGNGDAEKVDEDFNKVGGLLSMRRFDRDGTSYYAYPGGSKFNLKNMLLALREGGYPDIKVVDIPHADVFLNAKPAPEPQEVEPTPAAVSEEIPSAATPETIETGSERQQSNDTTQAEMASEGPEKSVNNTPEKKMSAEEKEELERQERDRKYEEKERRYEERQVKIKNLKKTSINLGQNHRGDDVYEIRRGDDKGVRCIVNYSNSIAEDILREDTQNDLGGSEFMRVTDANSLRECVQVLADKVIRGKIVRFADLEIFAKTHFGDDFTEDQIQSVIASLDNQFSYWMRKNKDISFKEMFEIASSSFENSAYLNVLERKNTNISSLNMPLSVISHRIANGLAKDDTNAVFINPGRGAPFAKWNRGRKGSLKVYEARKSDYDGLMSYARDLGIRSGELVNSEEASFEDSDVIIGNVESGWLEAPKTISGTTFTRKEFATILTALKDRSEDGNALFSFPYDASVEGVSKEFNDFLETLGREYAVEGVAEIDSFVHAGVAGAERIVMLSVGSRRPELLDQAPEPSLRRREIFDNANLLTWSSEVLKSRAKIDTYLADLNSDESAEQTDELKENSFQKPYISASRVSEPDTCVPLHLDAAMRQAMSMLMKSHPDVDEYVSSGLDWDTEKLAQHFSAEQVDAMALEAFGAEQEKRGFHIGDQTGIGKGRTAAGIAGRHIMIGNTVFMLTSKAGNIDDIIRDFADAGILPMINPLIYNKGQFAYTDPQTGEEYSFEGVTNEQILEEFTTSEEVFKEEVRNAHGVVKSPAKVVTEYTTTIPPEYNVVIATYSQISGDLKKLEEEAPNSIKAAKLRAFINMVDENSTLIIDEAQKATGQSNTGKNVRHVIDNAGRTVFMSATHAKDVKTMGLYNVLFPEYLTEEVISDIMSKGGENAQEVISAMLAQNGVFIRREHDNSKLEFDTFHDEEKFEYNKDIVNSISPILSEIAFISGDVNRRLNSQILDVEAEIQRASWRADDENLPEDARRAARAIINQNNNQVKSLQSGRIGFGSPLFRIMKSVIAAAKAPTIAELAIKDIREGRKPVIMADGTHGALYKELYEKQNEEGREISPVPSLKDMMHREMRSIFATTLENISERQARLEGAHEMAPEARMALAAEVENDAQMREKIDEIMQSVDELPDFDISLIDIIRTRAAEEGFKIGEITGRSYIHDGEKFAPRRKPKSSLIVNEFNNGDMDGVIVNKSGLEGLSMQDAEWFLNHGQRVMYEGDSPLDINDQIQGYGRVNRKGSRTNPRIVAINTGIPGELRNLASRNAKLRKLSANVSSNRDNSALIDGIPDMFNSVGDRVCNAYFERRPDILVMMGYEDTFAEENEDQILARDLEEEVSENRRTASQILSRITLLRTEMQEQILQDLQNEYDATILELDAENKNPLRPKVIPGEVTINTRTLFEGPSEEMVADAFDSPVFLEEGVVETMEQPLSGEDVDTMVSQSVRQGGGNYGTRYANAIKDSTQARLTNLLKKTPHATVDAAIAAGDNKVSAAARKFEQLAVAVEKVVPGCEIRIKDYFDEPVVGVVTAVSPPDINYGDYMNPQRYRVNLVVPGDAVPRPTTLANILQNSGFHRDEEMAGTNFNIWDGLNSPDDDKVDAILRQFDHAGEFKMQKRICMLTGNILRALQIIEENKSPTYGSLGSICVVNDEKSGVSRRVAVINRMAFDGLNLPVSLRTPEMSFDALCENDLTIRPSTAGERARIMTITSNQGAFEIKLPKPGNKDFGKIYENPRMQEYLDTAIAQAGNAANSRNFAPKFTTIDPDEVLEFLRIAVVEFNVRFTVGSQFRDWANDWSTRMNAQANGLNVVDDINELKAKVA